MESKFVDQDVDVVFLANKGIVIRNFVGRNYNKILMETGKFVDNIRVTKNELGSGVDRMCKLNFKIMQTNEVATLDISRLKLSFSCSDASLTCGIEDLK